MNDREKQVDEEMEKVFFDFRLRWCEAKQCWCLGCVNAKANISKQEWIDWKKRKGQK